MEQGVARIHPGEAQAVLVLDNGRRVSLKEKEEGELAVAESVRAIREKGVWCILPG